MTNITNIILKLMDRVNILSRYLELLKFICKNRALLIHFVQLVVGSQYKLKF